MKMLKIFYVLKNQIFMQGLILQSVFLIYVYVYVFCVGYVCVQCSQRSGEGVRHPGAGITGRCELPNMGTRN